LRTSSHCGWQAYRESFLADEKLRRKGRTFEDVELRRLETWLSERSHAISESVEREDERESKAEIDINGRFREAPRVGGGRYSFESDGNPIHGYLDALTKRSLMCHGV
jgi:hypothetical protein